MSLGLPGAAATMILIGFVGYSMRARATGVAAAEPRNAAATFKKSRREFAIGCSVGPFTTVAQMIAKVVGVGDDGQKTGAESLVEGLMEGRRHRVRFKLLYRQGLNGILSWTQTR